MENLVPVIRYQVIRKNNGTMYNRINHGGHVSNVTTMVYISDAIPALQEFLFPKISGN
jgi:hypothetical protein